MDELPVELLSKIVTYVTPIAVTGRREGKADLCNLRLVSNQFNDIVSPVLFHRLSLRFKDATFSPSPDCARCQDIIAALATGTTRVFQYTKVLDLSVSPLFSASRSESLGGHINEIVIENMYEAVSSLQSLQAVSWLFDSGSEPTRLANDFIRALGTIQSLHTFERLAFPEGLDPSISLQPISNLASLRLSWHGRSDHFINEMSSLLARCPDMGNLCIDAPYFFGDGTVLGELFADVDRLGLTLPLRRLELNGVGLTSDDIATSLRHFREIEFIGISRNPNPLADSVLGEICAILKQEDIFLKGICTDLPEDPLLLEYLISYSGLEELLFDPRPQSPDCPPDLVEKFYTEILPPHYQTLKHLKFTCWPLPATGQDDQPSLNPFEEVAKCRRLRVLDVRYSGDGLRKDPGNFQEWLEVCAQLQNLTQFDIYSYLEPTIIDTLERFREKNGKQFLVWGW